MPDRDPADEPLAAHLAGARQRLLDEIEQPGLDALTRRASTLRRRRSAGTAAAAVLVFLSIGTGVVQASRNADRSPPSPGDRPSASETVTTWTGAGITISGASGTAKELPGDVVDVEFVDQGRGYLLTAACAGAAKCAVRFAATEDGGRSWTLRDHPGQDRTAPESALPLLLTLGDQVIIADRPTPSAEQRRYTSTDGGRTWSRSERAVPAANAGTGAWPAGARPWVVADAGGNGCGSVYAWTSGGLVPTHQPGLSTCWAATVPDAAGGWWVGGLSTGAAEPAVAVTRDGGLTWQTHVFADEPAGATGARVALLGSHVSVVTLGARLAVYTSVDLGRTFGAGTTHSGAPGTLAGDPVPLLDGRLLVLTGESPGDTNRGRWYVTADGGSTWENAGGLHDCARLARTPAGYVAYRLSGNYTAFSADGSAWRKLNAV